MSKNIKGQFTKKLYISKIETLQNSYNSLKSILSPNLSKNNNSFMSYLIELLISQIKFFVNILNLSNDKKLYENLNSNNQNLSKQIAILYEISKSPPCPKLTLTTSTEKDNNDNNQFINNKESYSLEEKKDTINQKNSDNVEYNFNINTESKAIDNYDIFDSKNNEEYKNNLNNKEDKDKLKQINNIETEKNEIIRNINFNTNQKESKNYKEKEKFTKLKSPNIIYKKSIQKRQNKDKENKLKCKKKFFFSSKKPKNYLSTFRLKGIEGPSYNIEPKINTNLNCSKKGLNHLKDKIREKSYDKKNKTKIKVNKDKAELTNKIKNNYQNEDNIDEQSNEENDKVEENIELKNNNETKFKRKGRKAKTVLFKTIKLPYLIGIETSENDIYPDDNYISITLSNDVLNGIKTQNNSKLNQRNINFKTFDGKKLFNSDFKTQRNLHINTNDYFSLDEFLIPSTGKNGEKLFLTKKGKVLLNKKQKDILEDYVNNYLYDEDEEKISVTEIDNDNKRLKDKKNKKYYIQGTTMHYNLNDVTEVLQMLPKSFKIPIDDFYLRKKKASMFDRGIFKICHKVINNYKILEGKEDIFQYKKSKSRTKYNINQRYNKFK